MDAETLGTAMGWTLPAERYRELLHPFNSAMLMANVTNVPRAAMWCAQLGHECVGLKYQNELWGPTPQQRTYDGRMGNRPGTDDWSRYRGHGWIQITGRDNHTAVSKWAAAQGFTDDPNFFIDRPEALGWDQYAGIGAAWYWTVARPHINEMCDRGDLVGVTRAINGGTYGLDDRRRRYHLCLELGTKLLPTEGYSMSWINSEGIEVNDQEALKWIDLRAREMLVQLVGPGKNRDGTPNFSGFPQLGNRTLVDAVAALCAKGGVSGCYDPAEKEGE